MEASTVASGLMGFVSVEAFSVTDTATSGLVPGFVVVSMATVCLSKTLVRLHSQSIQRRRHKLSLLRPRRDLWQVVRLNSFPLYKKLMKSRMSKNEQLLGLWTVVPSQPGPTPSLPLFLQTSSALAKGQSDYSTHVDIASDGE